MTLDRYGEPDDDPAPIRSEHDPRCQGGWLGADIDGRPVPCLQCRPHLAKTVGIRNYGDQLR
jgi:hypothetical protein